MSTFGEKIEKRIALSAGVKSVFLIDDDQIANFINQKTIAERYDQMEITSFRSSQKAMEALESEESEPDLLILDLNMPIQSGWDFLDQLHARRYSFPTVILTSSFKEEDKQKAASYNNVIGFLTKPLSMSDLLEYVHIS